VVFVGLLVVLLLYLEKGYPISHFRGDLEVLNEGVSRLADILEKADMVQSSTVQQVRLDAWAKENPRPRLVLSSGCLSLSRAGFCGLQKVGGLPEKSSEDDAQFNRIVENNLELIRTLKKFTAHLSGIATSTDTDSLLQDVLYLQSVANSMIGLLPPEAISGRSDFGTPVKSIDISTLPSIKSIPLLPDFLTGYLSIIRFRVLRDIVHETRPVIENISLVFKTGLEAVEMRLNTTYYEEEMNLLKSLNKNQKYSDQAFIKLGYTLQQRANTINAMKRARISSVAGMLGPSFGIFDHALQGKVSEDAAHSAFYDFANAAETARLAVSTLSSVIESRSSQKGEPTGGVRKGMD
jgi:hypothetical protein